uniref:NADH-ubiquinone oxidoreductase chain 3 n=1 Tax=Gregariella coralliophaga TaxID=2590089 RepID=A0A516EZH0_9BIVA|nr:NADH dehydrogenase subunit 3 [Gregariella coralliophaga]QDO71901.1 NADH dehydrogenase subunit 3 [Gregariella coralliophaga]
MVLFSIVLFMLILSTIFTVMFLFLSEKGGTNREKSSPYECGFETIGSARSTFSVRFFLVAVLFVVFDVEVVLVIPLIYMVWTMKSVLGILVGLMFIFVLFLGLFHEYREGSLNWV